MKKGWIKNLLPHLIAVIVFLIVAVIYCKPVLQGNVLDQGDVTQWKAMSKDLFDYKEKHGEFPLWTKSMFSGMPAYQIALEADNPVSLGIFYHLLTLGMPKPISFFFLACICFYIFSQVLRVSPWIGIAGALAYAYVTYNAGIIEAGHDTKMQAIAVMPAFIGSLILLYEGKYIAGAAMTALFTAMFVGTNHFQIVYYALIIVFFMTIGYLVSWIRQRNYKHMILALVIALVTGITGVLCNAVTIFTTRDASKTTIRGGTELPEKNSTSEGLSKDYALSYSMYKSEPLVMMVPNMYGGSGAPVEEKLEESKALEALQMMPQEISGQIAQLRTAYWGGLGAPGQVPPNAPPYAGAIICFLALIGFFILDNRHKWWILGASVLAFMMSWGSYFDGFNTFLLNNLPMYNKFRVPSMIIVIPTFLFCMMAILTLQQVIRYDDKEALWKKYKNGLMLTAGIFVVLLIFYFSADFLTQNDRQLSSQVQDAPGPQQDYIRQFLNALKDDRQSLFMASLGRSFFFIAVAALMVWLAVRKKISQWITIAVIGLFAFIDVMAVDVKYLNEDNYRDEFEYTQANFTPSPADAQIMQDTSYYRVFDLRYGLTGAMPAYFHNSIVGYHPAKLSIYQDLIEYQISKFPQSMPVIHMLNTKYFIQADNAGNAVPIPNPEALGPAWFVKAVRFEKAPMDVMNALTTLHPRDTAVLFEKDKERVVMAAASDSADQIQLVKIENDEVIYRSRSAANRFGVFSEVFYDLGWKAFIDGKETPIIRTNYILRGLSIPAGEHDIRFVFHPESYYSGKTVSLVMAILVYLLIIAAVIQLVRQRRPVTADTRKKVSRS